MKFYCYSCGKEEEGYFIYNQGKFYIQFECGEQRTAEEKEIQEFLKGTFRCRPSDGMLICRELSE